jgi:endoglucanase
MRLVTRLRPSIFNRADLIALLLCLFLVALPAAPQPVTDTAAALTISFVSGSVSPATAYEGQSTVLTAAVKATTASGIIIYFDFRSPAGGQALARWTFPGQYFSAGETKTYRISYIVPSGLPAGKYNFALGAFSADWRTPYLWNYQAASLSITAAPVPNPEPSVIPIGINISGTEYSWCNFPTDVDLTYLKNNGLTLIRLPVAWERVQPKLFGSLDPSYVSGLRTFISKAGTRGMQVAVDLHNYGRYNRRWAQDAADNYGYVAVGKGDIIGSAAVPVAAFADLWTKLARELKGTSGLGYYDIMNEPYNMGGPEAWPTAAQAAVDAIRSVDMGTSVLVEGTQWASAYWWPWDNGNLRIKDPANKLLYEAHLYFDNDGGGKYLKSYAEEGAYPNVGVDRVQPFLTWLRQNNAKGFLGEFGVPNNDPRWLAVLDKFLAALRTAGIPGTYWNYTFRSASGPSWWPVNEPMSIRLDNGQANPQMSILSKHNQK